MIDGPFALAFTAGMLATVNPCGFAMLPAYLSFFLGLERDADGERTAVTSSIGRALVVSASVAAGFMAVFVPIGILLDAGIGSLAWARYASIAIGVVLVALGIAVLFGYRLALATPKLERGGRDRTAASMALFGVSYAIASLGCTIPLFIVYGVATFTRSGVLGGVLSIAAYGLGVGLVLTALTVTLATARGGLLRVLRGAMRIVDRLAGALLVLAGAYLVYYWAFSVGSSGAPSGTSGGLARWFERRAADVAGWVEARDALNVGLVLGAIVVVAAAVVVARRGADR